MRLKNFENYSKFYSKDPSRFEKRVAIASKFDPHPLFERVSDLDQLSSLDREVPLIMWDNFNFGQTNESSGQYLYNRSFLQDPTSIVSMMKGEDFIPKSVESRQLVKGLKFPVIGLGKKDSQEYRTYYKFKQSEKTFPIYQEKIMPRGKYEVLTMDGKPVHIIKRVNGVDFDADMSRFKWQDQLSNVLSKIQNMTESNIFVVHLMEKGDSLFLDKVVQEGELTIPQSVRLYERLYESHHSTKLPTWFKKHVGEKYLKPHYQKMQYNKLLIKPTGVINYENLI